MRVGLVCLMLLAVTAEAQSIYTWTDKTGETHFTDNPGSIPKKYRSQARTTEGEEISVINGVRYPDRRPPPPIEMVSKPDVSAVRLLIFSATWCGPCKQLQRSGKLEELTRLLPDLSIEKIDIDAQHERADQYKVRGVPSLLLVNGSGKELGRVSSAASSEEMAKMIRQLAPARHF